MRIVHLQITYELLTEIFTEGWEASARCVKGLPKGARLVQTFNDVVGNYAVLVFEHPSFDEVPLGQYAPILSCVFQTLDSGAIAERVNEQTMALITNEEFTKLAISAVIETLPEEDKVKINECIEELRRLLKESRLHWGLALAVVGAEIAAEE